MLRPWWMVALVLVDHLMMQYAQCDLLGQDDYTARPTHTPYTIHHTPYTIHHIMHHTIHHTTYTIHHTPPTHRPPCRAVSDSMPVSYICPSSITSLTIKTLQ